MKRPSGLFCALALVSAAALPAAAAPKCKPVTGHFEAVLVPPGTGHCQPSPPAFFCTAGRVWGGIQGSYQFSMTTPTPSGVDPAIFFFTGQSTVFLKNGAQVQGTDTGTIDLDRGGFASLITFTGGTGPMAGVTGQIRLRGELGGETPTEATTSGDYQGEICTP